MTSATSPSSGAALSNRNAPSSGVVVVARGALAPVIHDRLVKALGDRRASEVFGDACNRFGDRLIETPQDLLDFAETLVKLGGLIQAVGRSLKVQALLRGAVER
jgi:hypothetical protein